MAKGGVNMNAEGIVTCPMCDLKFFASGYWIDIAKQITQCPMCQELMKVNSPKPMKQEENTVYYLVTYAHAVKGDSLAHASWVTRDVAFGGTSVWKNMVGGMCPSSDEDRVHEVTVADDIMDLDWTKTFMYAGLKEDFFTGWLSPDAEFVQSVRGGFENTAEYILGMSQDELKRKRWIRLDKLSNEPYYTPRNPVTKKQFDWLKEHGYGTFDPEDIE